MPSEIRYRRTNIDPLTDRANVVIEPVVTHASPAVNVVDHDLWHEVVAVDEPGTMSLMICGPRTPDGWCHLDVPSGKPRRDQPVPGFNALLAALNPHRQGQL